MGFFGKLFEKKVCDFCGGEIGLLGNRKLEDGNMCKECAAKLSPWFCDRRESTVAQIEEQLRYREENRAKLNKLQVNKSIGEYYKMFVEEINGVPYRFVVSRDNDYREANADIVKFGDVSSCVIDINEYRRELEYTNDKNEHVKYNPPRYEYQYDFYVVMSIQNNPYFDEMKFKLNRDSVDIETEQYSRRSSHGIGQFLISSREFDPSFNPEYRKYKQMTEEIEALFRQNREGMKNALDELRNTISQSSREILEQSGDVDPIPDLLEQIRTAPDEETIEQLKRIVFELLAFYPQKDIHDQIFHATTEAETRIEREASEAPQAQVTPRPKFCPECGAPVSGGKFCGHCGSKL